MLFFVLFVFLLELSDNTQAGNIMNPMLESLGIPMMCPSPSCSSHGAWLVLCHCMFHWYDHLLPLTTLFWRKSWMASFHLNILVSIFLIKAFFWFLFFEWIIDVALCCERKRGREGEWKEGRKPAFHMLTFEERQKSTVYFLHFPGILLLSFHLVFWPFIWGKPSSKWPTAAWHYLSKNVNAI